MKALKVTDKQPFFQIVIIGAGANGGYFFRELLHNISTYRVADKYKWNKRFNVDITICDEDKVERKNLGNQLFFEEDINEYKVVSLAERYGDSLGFDIKTVTQYITDLETLEKLFIPIEVGDDEELIPILCGMVDNNKSRQLMDEFFYSDKLKHLIYLDAGVDGVEVLPKTEYEYTLEDWEFVSETGFGGQIVVGVKLNGTVLLEPVTKLFSNIANDHDSVFPNQSCAVDIVNNPQRCQTNKKAAILSNDIMNNLLHTCKVYQHCITFDAQLGVSQASFIRDEVIEKFNNTKKQVEKGAM